MKKYKSAWKAKGVDFDGYKIQADLYMVQQDQALPFNEIAMSAWYVPPSFKIPHNHNLTTPRAAAMFNTWNPSYSRSLYPHMMAGYLTQTTPSGRYNLNTKPVADAIRAATPTNPASPEIFTQIWPTIKATALAPTLRSGSTRELMPTKPVFGCILEYVSEVGPREHLHGLLKHADEVFNPCWNKGGLYYQRCDQVVSDAGEWTFCDPFTGNALVAYARLNVEDGQRKMYEKPWTHEKLAAAPWIDGFAGFEQGVDFLRAVWDSENKAMVMTVKSWNGVRSISPVVRGLPRGRYEVYLDGEMVAEEDIEEDGTVELGMIVDAEMERDFVVVMAES